MVYLKEVNLILVNAVIGVTVTLVVGLAQVYDSLVRSVYIMLYRLVVLAVQVYAGEQYDLLYGGIPKTGLVGVSAVTYLELVVFVVGLVLERGERKEVVIAVFALGLHLEGVGVIGAAPSA